LIITTAQFGNAMKLPLDANYWQRGQWWSLAQVRGLHRSAAITRCRHGCCTAVLHSGDLDA
jgi:hypothetical protein